ncbi:hypothetical protein NDU88_004739 [Pleurodeles waltl]|uniref:Uncharacterized protein n=1 Tax=Pleurodeles waltl TaxID=8319 RepID=A0AAV7MA35_PLEWA|nr:hypothetical protein NDU88_004739 [Pleurodeles waltl]
MPKKVEQRLQQNALLNRGTPLPSGRRDLEKKDLPSRGGPLNTPPPARGGQNRLGPNVDPTFLLGEDFHPRAKSAP